MKYLKISNAGLLDTRLLPLMGATTKRSDETKFGEFGTGLKYALAYLLHNNIAFVLCSGEDEIDINVQQETIGEQTYSIMTVNGQRTSITTTMCHQWKGWHVVREIYCNALDEGDAEIGIYEGAIKSEPGRTVFYIQLVGEIKDAFDNFDKFFAQNRKPLFTINGAAIYEGDGKETIIYKNGIRVYYEEKPSVFHYDIDILPIDELRQCTDTWKIHYEVAKILCLLDKEHLCGEAVTSMLNKFEGEMSFDFSSFKFHEAWSNAIGSCKIISESLYGAFVGKLNEDHLLVVSDGFYAKAKKQFPHLNALTAGDDRFDYIDYKSSYLNTLINEATDYLTRCGYQFTPETKIKTGSFMNGHQLAVCSTSTNTIIIGEACVKRGVFDMICTLVEEYEHMRTGFADCSRDFQNHFIQLYVTTMLNKAGIII